MKKLSLFVFCAAFTLCLTAANLAAANAPQATVNLNSAANLAVLAGTDVTSTGRPASVIIGNLGVFPGSSYTPGTPAATVSGTIDLANTAAGAAQRDLGTAYNDAAGRSLDAVRATGNLGGKTLTAGLYKSTSGFAINLGETLVLTGDKNSIFIFQMASTLVTATGSRVILTGGVLPSNVFWQVGSSATLGATSVFQGTIMALASISLDTGAVLHGRALAQHGGVTFISNDVTVPGVKVRR